MEREGVPARRELTLGRRCVAQGFLGEVTVQAVGEVLPSSRIGTGTFILMVFLLDDLPPERPVNLSRDLVKSSENIAVQGKLILSITGEQPARAASVPQPHRYHTPGVALARQQPRERLRSASAGRTVRRCAVALWPPSVRGRSATVRPHISLPPSPSQSKSGQRTAWRVSAIASSAPAPGRGLSSLLARAAVPSPQSQYAIWCHRALSSSERRQPDRPGPPDEPRATTPDAVAAGRVPAL